MVSHYGYQQLLNAMFALSEEGTKKERLINAMDAGLSNITPDKDLPSEMQGDFNKFMSEIKNKGTVPETVDVYDETQVASAVYKIIGFFEDVCRRGEKDK